MPRLPTMRVIGSQFISTRFLELLGTSLVGAVIVLIGNRFFTFSVDLVSGSHLIRSWVESGGQFSTRMSPFWFFVDGGLRHGAQGANCAAIGANGCAGNLRPRGF